MSAIDLVIIGMIKKQPQSAYELQKNINYRNIDRWVSISSPSIYKKVIQLKEKGYLKSMVIKNGGLPEKTIYDITEDGNTYFLQLMKQSASKQLGFYLDMNAVVMHLDLVDQQTRMELLEQMRQEIAALKFLLEDNIQRKQMIPDRGKLILRQQLQLAQSLSSWMEDLLQHPDDLA